MWSHSKQPLSCVKETSSNSPDQASPLDSERQKCLCFQVPPHPPQQWCLSHTRTPNATHCPTLSVWALQPCPAWGFKAAVQKDCHPPSLLLWGQWNSHNPHTSSRIQLIPLSSLENKLWGDLLTGFGKRILLWLQENSLGKSKEVKGFIKQNPTCYLSC